MKLTGLFCVLYIVKNFFKTTFTHSDRKMCIKSAVWLWSVLQWADVTDLHQNS